MLWESPFIQRLGWTILHSLWEVLAMVIVLAAVLPLLRRRGPRSAYAGCCLALAMCLLIPIATFLCLPSAAANRSVVIGSLPAPIAQPFLPPQPMSLDLPTNAHPTEMPRQFSNVTLDQPADLPHRAAALRDRTTKFLHQLTPQLSAWLPWLVLAWMIGVGLLSIWNCLAWLAVQRLKTKSTSPVATAIAAAANRLAQQLGISQAVRLLQSALVESPIVIGVWRPVILLPAALVTKLSPAQLESLLAHELAHVLRQDYFVNLLQTAIETVLFYHPGVWWISSQVRQQREHCCDDLAVSVTPDRTVYVKALAAIVGVRVTLTVPAAAGGHLLPRLQRLLGIARPEAAHPARWLTGVAMLSLCGAFLAVSMLPSRTATAQAQPADKAPPEADAALASETGEFELRAVGPDDKPAPNATVEIRTNPQLTEDQFLKGRFVKHGNYGSFATTDAEGRLVVKFPKMSNRFDVNITTPGYGPYWATWSNGNQAEAVPARFTAELEAGWSVGGIVVDEAGHPVPDVVVSPSIEFKKRPGDLNQFGVGASSKTDADGKWRFDSVPASKKDIFVEINHPSYRPLRQSLSRSEFDLEFGQEPQNKIVLDPGVTVRGEVTDDAGQPIAGALIRTKFANDIRETRTDAEGLYKLSGCEPRTAKIVVSAKGKATDMQEVLIDDNMDPVDFEMQPGGTVQIYVRDEHDRPVPKARIFFQRWRGNRFDYFEFDHVTQYADQDGYWVWNEAPLDEFKADICGPEMELGSQPLISRNEPYVFRVPSALVVSGTVIDAETKQPIPKFQVIPGVRFDKTSKHWATAEKFTATDGKYRMRQTHDRFAWLVRIEADGYQAAVSRDIQSNEGEITINFELEKGKDVAATIRTPDGQPAAKAEIALGIAGSQIQVKNGEFRKNSTYAARQTADDAGKFHFPAQETEFQLVILHPQGYAHLKAASDTMPATISLNPWARVYGVFRVGEHPGANAPITIMSSALHSYGNDVPSISTEYETTAGKDGRFAFDRVFPGSGRIGRNIVMMVDRGATEVTSCCLTAVNFQSGESIEINLGGTGRPVIGKLQPHDEFDETVNWSFELIDVREAGQDIPPQPELPPVPDDVKDDPTKRVAWWKKWKETGAGQEFAAWEAAVQAIEEFDQTRPYFRASIERDGSFRIDDMPAGDYRMSIWFGRNTAGSLHDFRFTVPKMEAARSDTPLDLGILRLEK